MNKRFKKPLAVFGVLVALAVTVFSVITIVMNRKTDIATFSGQSANAADNPVGYGVEKKLNEIVEQDYPLEQTETQVLEKSINFDDGGVFSIFRFEFGDTDVQKGLFTYEIPLRGDDLQIHWQNYEVSPAMMDTWSDLTYLPKATLFLETEKESIILSIPALYYNRFDHKTIECLSEYEKPVRIEKTKDGYSLFLDYLPKEDTIGELWYYKCETLLIEWTEYSEKLWLPQDLHKNRRFCYDGYYFDTYTTYVPYAVDGFFRNPANFTGSSIMRTQMAGSATNIGYAMTKICLENQNNLGFWETGPMSTWLNKDYGIGYDFYDTRFSTDFAVSLVKGYKIYKDQSFLDGAIKYADFLTNYAEEEAYRVTETDADADGKTGLLIPDYWSESQAKKPHVSLNHQLAEINFLLELHIETGIQKYFDYAKAMLNGVEITCDDWIMEDSNLKYALMYTESSNNMVDYPYLTYNDLFETKELCASLGITSPEIEKLMAAKKTWMDANGITLYRQK